MRVIKETETEQKGDRKIDMRNSHLVDPGIDKRKAFSKFYGFARDLFLPIHCKKREMQEPFVPIRTLF